MPVGAKIKYGIILILIVLNIAIFYIVIILESVFTYSIVPYLFTSSIILYSILSVLFLKYEKIDMFDFKKWLGVSFTLNGMSFIIVIPSVLAMFIFLASLTRISDVDVYLTVFSAFVFFLTHLRTVLKSMKV